MNFSGKSILIVAGEASGDLHGASLSRELLKRDPSLHLYGVGGEFMRKAGVELIAHSSDISVTGLFEVVFKLRKIATVFFRLLNRVREKNTCLSILIDYPDFNLRLAKKLKQKFKIPIVYYISPQVWAWRKQRVYRIQKWIDRMLVVFPFEVNFYKKMGVKAYFVGHPLMEILEERKGESKKCSPPFTIALIPGSRRNEIQYLLNPILDAAKIIYQKSPNTQFLLPLAPSLDVKNIQEKITKAHLPIQITQEKFHETIASSDAAICCSGTASLETAILAKPMVVIYKVNWISYFLGHLLIRHLRFFGMPNILLGEKAVPELLQKQATGENMAKEILAFLSQDHTREAVIEKLSRIPKLLGSQKASQQAAEHVFEIISSSRGAAMSCPSAAEGSSHLGSFSLKAVFLWGLSQLYYFGIILRKFLYSIGFFKTKSVPVKVISIGNLSAGGTGKTPFTIYLTQEFQKLGKQVVILSRGYKRKSKKPVSVVWNEKHKEISEIGDEPSLMARKMPTVPIYIGKNRYQNAQEAMKQNPADIILLDDGFQHWKLKRDIDIVLVDAARFNKNEGLLPYGFLREPLKHLKRAHCVVLTRTQHLSEYEKKMIHETLTQWTNLSLVEANLIASHLRNIGTGEISPLGDLNQKKIFAFCGIGNPNSFKKLLSELGGDMTDFHIYKDHHNYSIRDLENLVTSFKLKNADCLMTTEKDAVRISSHGEWQAQLRELPFYALEVEMKVTKGEEVLRSLLNNL